MAYWYARVNGRNVDSSIGSRSSFSVDNIQASSESEARMKAIEMAKQIKNVDDVRIESIRKKS